MGLNSSKLSRSTATALAQKNVKPPPTKAGTSGVSFTKTNEIKQDGFDPHLGQMLNKLGPVQVPKLSTIFHPKDNMLKILENRGKDSSDQTNEQDLSSPSAVNSARKHETRLDLRTIEEVIRRHHINQGRIDPSHSNLDREGQEELENLTKTIKPETYQYLIQHFHPIDNIKLVKNPNPNQLDQPIKMAFWSQPTKPSQPM
ncbi:hypothetical protein PTTG_04004 [Puccinia triticina 1-1 BBBD Race 1]|uniref:Uncharacterized protein n=2 Tax=Puccinia triticina TaxID=208348 RepID=A0A180GVW9_PUCT1|nr:uncharacterized protein PtA15_7A206 [Puccinia triticina]OAV96432.1 hypothetical protein PTTG_04004 [Puccinia triticina 1-1 BBBD Race 1]WAQ86480.1 hypothetical protein PtA15_7A206 [Puccinia triticina]WAR56362.1 hypothetical protein PtB15_7B210 [Puccinia triticina]